MLLSFLIHAVLAAQEPQQPSRIFLLDSATGKPAANATVWIVDGHHPSRRVARDPFVDDATYVATAGRELHADATGQVIVPDDIEPVQIAARAGTRWGMVQVPVPPPPRIVVELLGDAAVEVHIVDGQGEPAAVTASVWYVRPGGTGSYGFARLRGDERGVALFRPASLLGAGLRTQWSVNAGRIDDGGRVAIQLDLVDLQPVLAALDERSLPAEVTLVAPAIGTVLVRATTQTDRPLVDGYATLSAVDADHPDTYTCSCSQPIVDGVARFPAVALGRSLRLQIQNGMRGRLDTRLLGPTSAGQVVEHSVLVPDGRGDGEPVHDVRGRLCNGGGEPLVGRRILASVHRLGGPRADRYVSSLSGADGGFNLPLVHSFAPGDEVVLGVSGEPYGPTIDHVVVRELAVDRAETVLGDVQPVPATLLCAGRVVDGAGRPVQATVSVHGIGRGRQPIGLVLPGTECSTDREGRFAAYAKALPAVPLDVSVQAQLFVARQVVDAGTKDMVITVPTTHRLEGRVMLAAAPAASVLLARLVPADRYGQPQCGWDGLSMPVSAPIAPDGSFVTWPVPAGTYHLVILLADAFEVAKVENVVVPESGPATDARLQAIDMIDALRAVTVLVETNGHAIDQRSELRIAPRLSSMAYPQQLLPEVAAELRPRPMRVWLPKGDFVATVQVGDRITAPVAMVGERVTIELPK